MAHAPTGIEILDSTMGGGFVRPSTILFFSDHPSEKRMFAEHFLTTGLRKGERCLLVDFFRAPQLVRRDLERFGAFPEDRLTLVDATSSQLLIPSTEPYSVRDASDLDGIISTIERAMEETHPDRVVIDSMEFLADRFPLEELFQKWRHLSEVATSSGTAMSYLFLNWVYEQPEVERIHDFSDYVIEFQSNLRSGVLEHSMRIRHNRPGGLSTNWIPFAFKELVGLHVYFPRILVTGPPNAGKSTIVRALCNNVVNVDQMGTTVAFDYGNVEALGLEAEVLGTPGQERFEFMFQIFAREVSGVMLVVDCTRPEDLPRARRMLELVGRKTPFVILANKSDLGSITTEELKAALDLAEGVPVIKTIATEGVGVLDALKELAERMVGAA